MSKTDISKLASVLVDKHGLPAKDAENFVTLMFDILSEGLKEEKQVKLKGLGTFKVTSVSPRESINVNTGERIVIDGRDKISFVPDASMRDLVNSPFSQFETVVVSDGVDFSSIDGEGADISDENVMEKPDDVNENSVEDKAVNDEKVDEKTDAATKIMLSAEQLSVLNHSNKNNEQIDDEPEKPVTETDIDEKKQEEDIIPLPVEIQDNSDKGEGVIELAENDEPTEDNTEQIKPQTIMETKEKKNENEIRLEDENSQLFMANDDLRDQVHRSHNTVRILVACIAVMLIGGFLATYYIARQIEKRDNRIEHLLAQTIVNKQKQQNGIDANTQKKADSIVNAEKQAEIKAKAEISERTKKELAAAEKNNASMSPQPKKPKVEKMEKAKKVEKTEKNEDYHNRQYSNDPRIRTGAYNIDGISRIVTVRKGQTFNSICKSYLGSGMECYVEAVNGGIKDVKEGQKIKIPKLKLKKRR